MVTLCCLAVYDSLVNSLKWSTLFHQSFRDWTVGYPAHQLVRVSPSRKCKFRVSWSCRSLGINGQNMVTLCCLAMYNSLDSQFNWAPSLIGYSETELARLFFTIFTVMWFFLRNPNSWSSRAMKRWMKYVYMQFMHMWFLHLFIPFLPLFSSSSIHSL